MSLRLLKCHIVGNHMSRLVYLLTSGDNDEGRPEYRLKNNCSVVKSKKAEKAHV